MSFSRCQPQSLGSSFAQYDSVVIYFSSDAVISKEALTAFEERAVMFTGLESGLSGEM
jgi:hypothetical protein